MERAKREKLQEFPKQEMDLDAMKQDYYQNINVNDRKASQPLMKSPRQEETTFQTVNLKTLPKSKKLTTRITTKSQLESGWKDSFLDLSSSKQTAVQQKNKKQFTKASPSKRKETEEGTYTDGKQIKRAQKSSRNHAYSNREANMAIKDHSNRMSIGSVKARKLDPLSHEPNSLGNTATQNSSKAFHRQRGHVNSVGNNILIKQM